MQRDAGVDLRTGVAVEALEGDADGHVRRAKLSDGTILDVDVVVASLGSIRNVEWLEGAELATGFWGLACDAGCRAFDINGVVTDNIFVAGDIARAPHVLYEYQFMSIEHVDAAVLGAQTAANNMVNLETGRRPHLPLPPFWSAQFGVNIKGAVSARSATRSYSPRVGRGSPLRRRLRQERPHRRGCHFQPRQMAGVLRRDDRTVGTRSRRRRRATTCPSRPAPSRCRPASGTRGSRPGFPMWF